MLIKNKKSKKFPILISLLVIFIGVASLLIYIYNSRGTSPATTNTPEGSGSSAQNDSSDPSQTSSIPVPDSVDPTDVKPYRLVTENETYKIRELDGKYTITLYAIVNRPDQSEAYYDQLREYKAAALNYLESHSVDTKKVNISYEPKEATNL